MLLTDKACVKDELTSKTSNGDVLLLPAITCLEEIGLVYGEQFILLQYIPAVRRVVSLTALFIFYRMVDFC